MDEQKAKFAFAKIKDDMISLQAQISRLEAQNEKQKEAFKLNSEIKKQIDDLKKFNLERFVTNMEKEFTSINTLIKDFNSKFTQSSQLMEKFSKQIEVYNLEFKDFKKKVINTQSKAENTNLDLEMLNQKFGEFQELILEKINLEINHIRFEFTDEISKLYDNVFQEFDALKKVAIKNKKK